MKPTRAWMGGCSHRTRAVRGFQPTLRVISAASGAGMAISALASLEIAAARNRTAAMEALIQILRRLAGGCALNDLAASEPGTDVQAVATRLAAAITRILTEPEIQFDGQLALRFSAVARIAVSILSISGFGGSDHILRILGAEDTDSMARLLRDERETLAKALLLFSLDSRLPIDVPSLLNAPPGLALVTAMNLMTQRPIITEIGHQRREALVGLAAGLKAAPLALSMDHLVLISTAWMQCSYATARDKHAIKPILNSLLRQWGTQIGLRDTTYTSKRSIKEHPTLLVAAEVMHSNHVQYRYFGQYLRQLKQRFRLVLITDETQVDTHIEDLFDEIHAFKRSAGSEHLHTIFNTIRAIDPDLLFWLSVGMRHWGPLLANFRLARIQMAGIGHSASTYSKAIDYYVTEAGYVGDPELLSEQLVLLPDESLVFERSPHHSRRLPSIRQTASPARIALPANLLKLNPHFITVLRRIAELANRPLQFHVFPSVSGLDLAALRRAMAEQLPGSLIYPLMPYNSYLEHLNTCDLSLSPFPFGGLHSVIDSLRQGLPVVAMEGLDLHERTDSMLLRRLGMPDFLIAHHDDEYIATAVRIINDDQLRVALSQQALALDVDHQLFGDATTPLRSEVVDALWWIHENHEAIQASGGKLFQASDRQRLVRGATGWDELRIGAP